MFFDNPHLSLTADLRHRELLAEAELFRLGRLARRTRRSERPPTPPAPPDRPASPAANTDAERRYAVSR